MPDSEQFTKMYVDHLEPHPFNQDLYSDRDNSELADRIDRHGYQDTHRIVVTSDGTILSGHRRYRAVKSLGWETVPVQVVDVDPDSDEAKRRILMANQHRDKNEAEKIREANAWEDLEAERAEQRRQEATGHTQKFGDAETGESDDKAAEKVGMSGEKYRQGKRVKEAAEDGDETAQEQWDKMESGEQTATGAYRELKESNRDDSPEERNPLDAHTDLTRQRIVEGEGLILKDGSGETYLLPSEELP